MTVEIVHRYTNDVLYRSDTAKTTRSAVIEAVKSGANLSGAYLRGADLSDADLSGAKMPGFADKVPTSLKEAALQTRDWLAEKRWIQHCWIKTPNGAYAGQCTACLHGAAVYVGGPEFGPQLSEKLSSLGYTVEWNDAKGRKESEVLAALDAVAAA